MNKKLFFCFFIAYACGSVDDLEFAGSPQTSAASLVGTWESDCVVVDITLGSYSRSEVIFNGNGTYTRNLKLYSTSDCADTTQFALYVESISYWVIRRVGPVAEERYEVDYESTSLKITPMLTTAESWNSTGNCESGDWTTDVASDRTEKDCHDTTIKYDLISIKDSKLYFGSPAGSTHKSRPVVLDSVGFTKKA